MTVQLPPDDPHARVIDNYLSRADQHAIARDGAAQSARRISWARLLIFVATAVAITFIVRSPAPTVVAWGIGLAGVVIFLALVRLHHQHATLARLHESLRKSCETGINRIRRNWIALPPVMHLTFARTHPFAADLHLAGETSLTQLLGPVSAGPGQEALAEWLLAESPPPTDVLDARQQAIAELTPLTDWRERLGVYAGGVSGGASIERFLTWAEGTGWLRSAVGLRVAVRVLGVVTPLVVVGVLARAIPGWIAAVFVLAGLSLSGRARKRLNATLEQASARGFGGRAYATMFDHATSATFESSSLRALQDRMGGRSAAPAFERLAQIATCAELRFSPLAHFIVHTLTLWDFHVVDALEGWQRDHGHAMRTRLRALGELESHSALATLSHDNPTWRFPIFHHDNIRTIEAKNLAHPLLSSTTRVANDVAIGPPRTFLLVTGSNMAGKTTLLRSVALNVVLAQTGAPVCADAFRLPRVRLRTSIHVQDALEEGLSLFMVELLRLKAIVDAARESDAITLLYIADEMLRGTNVQERRPAVGAVLRHLLRAGAIGAIATHDLELATEPDLASHARAVHLIERFRDSDAGPVMWFDYRLRPGVSTSRNALKLLEMVGLGGEDR
jgi:hypothetical protein